jgi:cysteine desulfuration protein SufE
MNGSGLEGMIEYLDYVKANFDAVGEGIPSIELLAHYGHKLGNLEAQHKTEDNKVLGCVSNVYIASRHHDDKVYFLGSSESLVVGGYVYILINAFNGLRKDEMKKTEPYINEFLEKTKLPNNLTPSRANALSNVYRLMLKKTDNFSPD